MLGFDGVTHVHGANVLDLVARYESFTALC